MSFFELGSMLLLMQIIVVTPGALAAQGAPVSREQIFAARCAKCHTIEKLAPALSRRSPEARAAFLDRFLSRHYAPDSRERKAIIELLGEATQKK